MILVDTSVWVDHLRRSNDLLSRLLYDRRVLVHPFVIGKLALGDLRQRRAILANLAGLPRCIVATEDEVMSFIDSERLFGRGIGYADAHLLAAVRLTPGTALWTMDKNLHGVAVELALAMDRPGG